MVSEAPATWVYYNKIGRGLVYDISPGKKEAEPLDMRYQAEPGNE